MALRDSYTRYLKPFIKTLDAQVLRNALRNVVNDKPVHHAISEPEHRHTTLPMPQIGG